MASHGMMVVASGDIWKVRSLCVRT
jgi:hypothetical protein